MWQTKYVLFSKAYWHFQLISYLLCSVLLFLKFMLQFLLNLSAWERGKSFENSFASWSELTRTILIVIKEKSTFYTQYRIISLQIYFAVMDQVYRVCSSVWNHHRLNKIKTLFCEFEFHFKMLITYLQFNSKGLAIQSHIHLMWN